MNQNPFLDGLEIEFTVTGEEVVIDLSYFEASPDLMGSPLEVSLKCLGQLGEIIYLQLEGPHERLDKK